MRYYYYLLLVLPLLLNFHQPAFAQKKQLLLVGTAHSFKNHPDQDFSGVQDRLAQFKPGLICIESIPAWDTISLRKLYALELAETARIMNTTGLTARQVRDSLRHYSRKSKKQPANAFFHARLAFFHYLSKDFSCNSFYNWFLAKHDQDLADTLLRNFTKTQQFTEYYNVVFPLAARLGLSQLYGVDDRSDHPEDIRAQSETQATLMTLPGGKEQIAKYLGAQEQYAVLEKKGKLFDLLNDTAYQNLLSGLITSTYPGITTAEPAKKMKELWEKRNLSIATRIGQAIRDAGKPDRVVVTFGAAHIPLLKEYLAKLLPAYEIINFTNR